MATLNMLLAEYPGDDAWFAYAASFRPTAEPEAVEAIRQRIPQDPSLADTLIGIFGSEEAERWIERPIGALDGLSARQVLETREGGNLIVRHVLMRMPI